MVHKDSSGAGTLIIDIRLGKFGRYKAASGTLEKSVLLDLVGMLRQLRRARRWDVLELLVNKRIAPLELLDAFVQGKTDQLPSADDLRPLRGTIVTWLETLDRSESTKKAYRELLKHVGTERSTLAELPALLEAMRSQALRSGKRQNFNNARIAARSLMRWAVGEPHALYRALCAVETLRVQHRKGNPQTLEDFRALLPRLGDQAGTAWALALTGMRRDEYFKERYEVRGDRILIHGTKSASSDRTVFLVRPIAAPSCSYDHFRDVLAAATDGRVRVHDFRYTFRRWAEDAGISESRIEWYLGHSLRGGDVRGLYARGRGFLEYLGVDADRMRAFVGEPPRAALEVVAR